MSNLERSGVSPEFINSLQRRTDYQATLKNFLRNSHPEDVRLLVLEDIAEEMLAENPFPITDTTITTISAEEYPQEISTRKEAIQRIIDTREAWTPGYQRARDYVMGLGFGKEIIATERALLPKDTLAKGKTTDALAAYVAAGQIKKVLTKTRDSFK